ncbi:MAG: hypothetical protein LC642_05600, partial [Verrucomicrobiaceae bacterium]|nr:hypothetical protein [Verrucomicrobiaceae bacterium]
YYRVDVESLGGKVVWEKEFAPGGPVDSDQVVPLNWDEMVGQNRGGAVLFTAESLDPLSASGKRVGAQTLVQLTDLGAVWKGDPDETLLHVFSIASGKAIAGAKLQLIDRELQSLGEATTDNDGNARLADDGDARWVFVQTESDAHLVELHSGENSLPLYQLGVSEDSSYEGAERRYLKTIFLFTERGVYKPGEKLYVKGLARNPHRDEARLPIGQELTLTLFDAKERELQSTTVTTSEFGSFDAEITLPEGSLGRYTLAAAGEKESGLGGSCYFQVQEFRPNAFEVLIPKPPVTTGSTQLAVPITAKYFMGKPLSKARLTWSLVARDQNFQPEGLTDFVFCNGIYDFRLNRALDRISQFNAQGEVPIGENGLAQVNSALPVNPKAPQPRAAKLLCEVTDLNQQTVSESRSFVQHASEFYFGLRRFEGVLTEGAPLPIELIAVSAEGKPLDQPQRATIRLTKIDWQTNRLAMAGNTSAFESKAQLKVLWERELTTAPGIGGDRKPQRALLTDAKTGKPGEYLLEAIGKDAQGHDVLTAMVFEVSGDAETDWNYRNTYVVDLVADKDSYNPGDTATILVKTPISGEALVTVERDRILRSFNVALSGNAPSVQVPIAETDGPNVFVSVMLLRGANDSPRKIKAPEYRIGYANLKVAQPKEKLAVEVRSAAPSARPGENVRVEAEVRDWKGTAAPDAEVALYAVDEGVLSLTGYETPDALTFFNQPRGLSVNTGITLPTLLSEDMAPADFANKGYLIGDGKGGPELLNGLRKEFRATAFWNAKLRTDSQGRVRAEFAAPDSLTRYRIIAIAVTREAQFGAGESAVEINKPIMIESAMPAFANVGDKLILRAVVHNTTSAGGKADVTLKVDATAHAAQTNRTVDLPAGASVPVEFPVEMVREGVAAWSWSVRYSPGDQRGALSDAVQAKINVRHPAPVIRHVQTQRVEGDSAEILRVTDPQIIEGSGGVIVSLTNTRVLELRESLRYLLEYPYG